ncbi:MAG TPA: hypothetical protein VI384_04405 [Candidatus Dormibacteraeota bacterium]
MSRVSCNLPGFCVCAICSSKTASEHRAGDERFGRDWRKGDGCGCGTCRSERAKLDDIDNRFAHISKLEDDLRRVRVVKAGLARATPDAATTKGEG